jgi:hypothetical protein
MGRIGNREALESIFGGWPSFHDSEVLSVRLDDVSANGKDRKRANLEVDIHVFEATGNLAPQGFYELRHHTLVTFAFRGIADLKIEGFDTQNVLWDLELTDLGDQQPDGLTWQVNLPASVGFDASYRCEAVDIVRAVPFVNP